MPFYDWFSRLGWPSSYLGKLFLVCFLGVHLPLIALVAYVVATTGLHWGTALPVLAVALIATLAGTGLALAALHGLMAPIRQASEALRAYLADRSVPTLPTEHEDQAGRLLADVQETLTRLDGALDAAHAARDRAVEDHRTKFQAIAKMSHEIRTPLNHIIGFAEIMQHELLGPLGTDRYLGYSADIRTSGSGLLTLLQDVLDLSQVEAGSYTVEAVPVDVYEVTRRAVALNRLPAERMGVRLSTRLQSGLPPIQADPRAVKQMLLHILAVAIGNTPSGQDVMVRLGKEGANLVVEIDHDRAPSRHAADAAIGPGGLGFDQTTPAGLAMILVRSLARLHHGALDLVDTAQGVRRMALRLPVVT